VLALNTLKEIPAFRFEYLRRFERFMNRTSLNSFASRDANKEKTGTEINARPMVFP